MTKRKWQETYGKAGVGSRPTAARKRRFEPWHLPRKMYLREEQWLPEIRRLAKLIGIDNSRDLSYLSLPGEDLLDVRLLHDFCAQRGAKLKFLGFDERLGNRRQVALSQDTLNMPNLAPGFQILPHRFEMIGEEQTHQYEVVKRDGPFDVVNLDLCGPAESGTKPRLGKFHPAFYNLFRLQHERQEPWLFFLTTRCTSGEIPEDDMARYWEHLKENASGSPAYESFLKGIFPHLEVIPEVAPDSYGDNQALLSPLFAVCMGKWLLGLCCDSYPAWRPEMLSCYCYRVTGAALPNMLSMAFKFSPVRRSPEDRAGWGGEPVETPEPMNETKLAEELLESLGVAEDVDVLLNECGDLRAKFHGLAANLLQRAGYDREKFRRFSDESVERISRRLNGAERYPFEFALECCS